MSLFCHVLSSASKDFKANFNYILYYPCQIHVQSTLVISKSKGPSKTVRDIRTSTYQICSIEEKAI